MQILVAGDSVVVWRKSMQQKNSDPKALSATPGFLELRLGRGTPRRFDYLARIPMLTGKPRILPAINSSLSRL